MPTLKLATLSLLLACTSLLSCSAPAQQPNAITNDPEPNSSTPTQNLETVMDSHGSNIMGLFLLASGTQPHPTVILLHGFPGYEQNIDLAQSLRRDGWNVLAMHYRGAWGSQGAFSFLPLHGRRLHYARLRHAARQRDKVPHRHPSPRSHRPQHGRLPYRRRARPAS